MALRREDVYAGFDGSISNRVVSRPADVVCFPTIAVRRRAARRRRVALARRRLAASAVVVVLAGGFLLAGGPGANAPASRPGAPKAVVLQAGDTLWDVAGRYAPDSVDTRAYVDALLEINHLQGAPSAGMRLKLPR